MNNQTDEDIDDLFIRKKPQHYIFAENKADAIREQSNASVKNCLRLVAESEKTGIATIEELSTQRETLEKAENNLDSINAMTRATQKNLNSMKSLFGGIKSYFTQSNTNASLTKSATMNFAPESPKPSRAGVPDILPTKEMKQVQANSSTDYSNNKKDGDFGHLNQGLGRLKELALKLGDEIEDQNDILDRITDKAERAGDTIQHQNRQMKQLLRK